MASSAMAMASTSRHYLVPTPTTSLYPSSLRKPRRLNPRLPLPCRCSSERDPNWRSGSGDDMRLAKLAVVTLAAGVLTLGSVQDASAAKSGGRVGGQAFRSAAPRASSPRINNSRTNIFINPPVAPPLVGGYGYGFPFYGGWGWSPFSFFAPGPSVAVGVGGGFDPFVAFLVLSAVATVVRRFIGRRDDDDDEDY